MGLTPIFYGLFGSLNLGVTVDWILTGGGIILLILVMQQPAAGNAHAG
jgi:hypothetical protein